MVEALNSFDDVATRLFRLTHIYHLLFEMTRSEHFKTNLNGLTWMVQLWLQWHFPKFRVPNLEFPEEVAPTRILAKASPTNHSTLACLYLFRICRTRADLEWDASMLRIYPWFSDQIFQDAFWEDANSFCKEKFVSCIHQQDLAWGVRSDYGYEHGLEVYHPNFYGRQPFHCHFSTRCTVEPLIASILLPT